MGERKRVKLSDLGRVVTGKTPSTKNEAFWNGSIPFVTPGDLQSTKHIFGTARYVTDDGANAVGSAVLPAGSICVSCIGVIGYVGITTTTSLSNQQINSIVVNQANDRDFVYYLLKSKWDEFKQMEGFSSVVSILNKTTFSDIEAFVPDLPTQRRIAAVLGALDDKIEVNRKICENLEAQAQALFKAWFVDFEPFGGKRPEGWKMGKLGDVAEYYDGKIEAAKLTPASYFSTENMLANREGAVDAETVPQSGVVPLCDEGCVLVSNIRPYFKKIIRVNCVGGHSPDVLCFKAKALERQWYLYRMLWDDAFFAYVMSSTKGTKMPRGDKGHIMDYPCVLPFANDIRKFNDTLASLSGRIEVANRESRALAAMRDALLPKLMSGELAVEKVEVGDACASYAG